ncbi:hypothetical protein HanRHA438_Chr03g0112691 [Helianthus annuus]|nr:hypothetical protein HanRHA438_Chr03g0112691 [Helianthus annuus]
MINSNTYLSTVTIIVLRLFNIESKERGLFYKSSNILGVEIENQRINLPPHLHFIPF